MRTKTTMIGMIFGFAMMFAACGGLKVGLDEEAQDALDCLASEGCEDEDSSDTPQASDDDADSGDSEESDDVEDSNHAESTGDTEDVEGSEENDEAEEFAGNTVSGDSYAGSKEDDDLTGGGFIITEPNGYEQTDDRYFMGTYENFHDNSPDCAYDYNYPNVVRAYSHNDDAFIDFETNTGGLVWIAEQYPDDTLDFSVRFLDLFGDPSVRFDCTCTITEAYYNYYNDRIGCSCEGDDGVCTLSYEKM